MIEGHMGESKKIKFQKAIRRFVHNFDGRAVSILQLLNTLQLEAANKVNVGPVYKSCTTAGYLRRDSLLLQ